MQQAIQEWPLLTRPAKVVESTGRLEESDDITFEPQVRRWTLLTCAEDVAWWDLGPRIDRLEKLSKAASSAETTRLQLAQGSALGGK
jgi:hypothetical protein